PCRREGDRGWTASRPAAPTGGYGDVGGDRPGFWRPASNIRVQRIGAGNAGLVENVSLHGLERILASEVALQAQRSHVQGVDGEGVVVQALVVPWRRRAVVTAVHAFQGVVAGKEVSEAVDA